MTLHIPLLFFFRKDPEVLLLWFLVLCILLSQVLINNNISMSLSNFLSSETLPFTQIWFIWIYSLLKQNHRLHTSLFPLQGAMLLGADTPTLCSSVNVIGFTVLTVISSLFRNTLKILHIFLWATLFWVSHLMPVSQTCVWVKSWVLKIRTRLD